MQETLNFGKGEKENIRKILFGFEQAQTTNYFEEQRVKRNGCTITLYESGKLSIQGPNAAKVKDEILSMMGLSQELVIGMDETGRGEKTCPLVITGVLADTNELRQVRHSKKTTDIAAKEKIVSEKMLGSVSVVLNSRLVDLARKRGLNLNEIEAAAMDKISEFLSIFGEAKIIADGAPMKTANKKINFAPKADDSEPVVGAASIVAKHLRNISSDSGERKTWNTKEGKKNIE